MKDFIAKAACILVMCFVALYLVGLCVLQLADPARSAGAP